MTARLAIIASVIVAFVFLGTAPGMVFAQETTPGATQEPSTQSTWFWDLFKKGAN